MRAIHLLLSAGAAALLGGMLWLGAATPPPAPATASVAAPLARGSGAVPPRPPLAVPADVPPDVPADEWRRVKAALETTPEGRRELPRVAEFLSFRHRVGRWQAGGDVVARAALAQRLLDELPVHVARREMTGGEAQALVTALLQERYGDPAALRAAVQAQLARVQAAQPAPDAQAQAREQAALAAYRRREAAIAAQWQALPVAQRDQQWLEAQLEAARRETLGVL